MKELYKQATSGYKWWQHAILIAVLIFIGICSAALFIAIGAKILGI